MRRIPLLVLLLTFTVFTGVGCAAQRHFDRGEAALLANDPVKARHHFSRALEHDPKLAQKPDFAEPYRVAQRDAAVVEGQQALRLRDPLRAIERFETALEHEPHWPAAADGLRQAHADAADASHRRALRAADDGRLDHAREALEDALHHLPTHAGATEALASLAASAVQPPTYAAGQQAVTDRQWDDALSAFRQSIATQPNFLPARAAVPTTLDAAARDMLDTSRDLLALRQFDDAEAAAQRTTEYRPGHAELEPLLGSIDLARGDDALTRNLPGAAVLWFRQARDHLEPQRSAGLETARAGIQQAAQQLRDLHRLDVTLRPESERHPGRASALTQRVQQQLQARPELALAFVPTGQAVALRLTEFDLPPAEVEHESLLHAYDVLYDVPNPARPRLEHELRDLERCIDDLCRREARLERRYRRLHREHPHGPSSGSNHEVHRVHRELEQVRCDLREAREDLRRVTHRLLAEPHFITKTRVEHWPYTRSTYERTARLVVSFTPPQGQTQTLKPRVIDGDTTLSPARPDLGLPEDPLVLLTDAELEDKLLSTTADRLAQELSRALVQPRVDALLAEASRLQPSDPIAAREARVAAEILSN
ncbi:MAG: hypothetical protein AAF911_14425 [Planctomycetota bacterium]